MFCIDNRCTDVYFSLAAEEYLLKKKRDSFFIIWQSVPSVVIGKRQGVQREVDEKYIHENSILLTRRLSGGGTVYHDEGGLNLNFMEAVKRPDFEYHLQQTADFLESLGIVAYTDKRIGICVDDRKVPGSAQCVHKNRVMYHCTLPYSANLQALDAALCERSDGEDLLPGSRVLRAAPSVRSVVANINEYLLPAVPLKHFTRLLFHFSFEGRDNHVYRFTPEGLAAIGRLKAEKYACGERIYDRVMLAPA